MFLGSFFSVHEVIQTIMAGMISRRMKGELYLMGLAQVAAKISSNKYLSQGMAPACGKRIFVLLNGS